MARSEVDRSEMGISELGNNSTSSLSKMSGKNLAYFKAGTTAGWLFDNYAWPYIKKKGGMAYTRYRKNYKYYAGVRARGIRYRRKFQSGRRRLAARPKKRKRLEFTPRAIAQRVGASNTKVHVTISNPQLLGTRLLNNFVLTDIDRTTDNTNILNRQTNIINVRGIKICGFVRNKLTDPLTCNYAIVNPKNALDVPTGSFFRNLGGTVTERERTFNTTNNPIQFHCNPINKDKFNILMHKRFVLNSSGDGAVTGGGRGGGGADYKVVKRYMKINRQIAFTSGVGTSAQTPIFLCFWFDSMFAAAGSASIANAVAHHIQVWVHYREPKN